MIARINRKILKEEECIARLHANIKKLEKEEKSSSEDLSKTLTSLRSKMAKSACEMQHNEVVLEETTEKLTSRKSYLEHLHKDLVDEEIEFEMLQALLYSSTPIRSRENYYRQNTSYTKEALDTLVWLNSFKLCVARFSSMLYQILRT